MKKWTTVLAGLTAAAAALWLGPVSAQTQYSNTETAVSLTLTPDADLDPGSRAVFMIFRGGEGTEPEADSLAALQYANQVGEGVEFQYDFQEAQADYTTYTVRLAVTAPTGALTQEEHVFYYNHPEAGIECVRAFREAKTAQDFQAAWQQYGDSHVLAVWEVEQEVTDNVVRYFLLLRDLYLQDPEQFSFDSTMDVLQCVRGGILLDGLENPGQDLAQLYKDYAPTLGDMYEAEAKPENAAEIFGKLEISQSRDLYSAIRKASIFGQALHGTHQDMMDILETYGEELGVDTDLLKEKGVTLAQIVQYMDLDKNLDEYLENLPEAFEDAADAAAKAQTQTQPGTNPGGGGGGGGGWGPTGPRQGNTTGVAPAPAAQGSETQPETQNPAQPETPAFNDLQDVEWAQAAINRCHRLGILDGNGDGGFAPQEPVTREQFVKLVLEALKPPASADVAPAFTDVEDGSWYQPYVRAAYSLGLVNGVSETEFGVGSPITRQDMVTMLYRANWIWQEGESAPFGDDSRIADYAKEAVYAYAKAGIVTGDETGAFRPLDNATRAEAAVIIARLLDYHGEVSQ